ncbi:MAG TPA: D-arabinono-1,4-lactone oxidase, partial [Sphingomicrobium sp.]|nr:D-arabinono-1,4-lactone oxidase [Sphingomicrobium sp.]
MGSNGHDEPWVNWAGTVQCRPSFESAPETFGIATAIADARTKGMIVRPRGSGHSFVPLCASDGHMLGPEGLQGILSIEPAERRARILSGTVIAELGEPLNAAGLALSNQGDIDAQTIAGAIATGTHGTGSRLGNLSTQLAAITMVTASGQTISLSPEEDRRLFEAAGVSLGSLGMFVDVTLNLLPRYRLREVNLILEVNECCAAFPLMARNRRHIEFFWLPHFDQCVVKSLMRANAAGPLETIPDSPLPPPGTPERYLRPSRTDWSHRIFPSKRTVRFNEMEFAVPIDRGLDCFLEIRELIRSDFPSVHWAVEYRTVAADTFFLSQAYGGDMACISVHDEAQSDWDPFFRAAQELFLDHGGRPHWG